MSFTLFYSKKMFKCFLLFIEDSTNKFFNDNWKMLADALYTVITQTIEDILLDVLKKIFHYIPANFFIEDIPTPAELYCRQKHECGGVQ